MAEIREVLEQQKKMGNFEIQQVQRDSNGEQRGFKV